jgi:hypothetical protein
MGVPPFFGLLMFVDVVEYDGRFFFLRQYQFISDFAP